MDNVFDILATLDTMPEIRNTPLIDLYPLVHTDDKTPVIEIQPDLENGPWIAGGAALQWYQGLPVGKSDIDIFCSSAKQAEQVLTRLRKNSSHYVRYNTDNAVSLEWSGWDLQVIKRRYYSNIQEVIDSFDITVCQIATTGTDWVMNSNTAKDIRERNLRFTHPLHPDSIKRLTKYWIYGYRPVEGTIDEIINDPITKWSFNPMEDYVNALGT